MAGCGDDTDSDPPGTTGSGGSGGTTASTGTGGTGGTGGGTGGGGVCEPGATESCYSGPAGTEGIGLCVAGTRTCNAEGSAFGACTGEVTPLAETCNTAGDDDCDGEVNEEGDGCSCVPGTVVDCYGGPPATEGVGPCKGGQQTCQDDGLGYGPCVGEVTPLPETCATPEDEDCDGEVNEEGADCVCLPSSIAPCYTGPAGTDGVGLCVAGTKTCNADGTAYGACTGEVTPVAETCNTAGDDDCDGLTNEGGTGCSCVPGGTASCYSGPPATEGVGACVGGQQQCNAQGTGYGPCTGEVTPVPETCATTVDDDCDGAVNEEGDSCACLPNSTASCYTGPANTENVGLCVGGTKTCNAQGTAYGACTGDVTPVPETCDTPGDDDCDGLTNESGTGCACVPGTTQSCYSGPPATENVGPCTAGQQTCKADGTAYLPCVGEVTPVLETCDTAEDDDCDGAVNEEGTSCLCLPNSTASCYTGPANTENVGLCVGGTKTCNAQGTAYGACTGDVTPVTETCNTPGDDDCDGFTNESGTGCACVPGTTQSCYSGPPATENVGPCTAGLQTCKADGTAYLPCVGEVTPVLETCDTAEDDDCDGAVNEEGTSCLCLPNSQASCYTGPGNTQNVGLCQAGVKTCNGSGTAYGACEGDVTPVPETCNTPGDDDCDGLDNEDGVGCVCVPGATSSCYSGPANTQGVGPCVGGQQTCNPQGTGFGPCAGEVTPLPESCLTPGDEDCDGEVNEEGDSCVCLPNSQASCYTGPGNTQNVGLCHAGLKTCNGSGTAYGACVGDVTPVPETCNTPGDDDCDGLDNEDGAGCVCVPGATSSCYSGPASTQGVGPCVGGQQTCNPQGTGFGPCDGEVTPLPESCLTPEDEDCDGEVNEEGAGCVCVPASTQPCYSGPNGTAGVGICHAGVETCNLDGTAYGPCSGEVQPDVETCNTLEDDDCDGATNEEGVGCVCLPGSIASCYSGPNGTQGMGICHAGTQTCNAEGTAYEPCVGEVLPSTEDCGTPEDDNCDGAINEGC